MIIRKFAGGGITYLPTTNRSNQGEATTTSPSTSKSNDFTKKIIDLVTENGIDSDVNLFLNSVEHTLTLSGDPTGENLSMKSILSLARKASLVKTNYEDYKKSRESLDTQDAWGDVAIDDRGNIYTYDVNEQKLKTVSAKELKSDPENYQVLTNEDLLNFRRNSGSMAFNNNILDNLSAAVGMKTITDYAKGLIDKFADTEVTGYVSKANSDIKSGMQNIVNASLAGGNTLQGVIVAGTDGVYKISEKSTIADTHMAEALNYLKISLPNTYRNKIKATAAVEGYTEDALLLSMLMTNTGRTITPDFESEIDPTTGRRSGGKTGSTTQQTDKDTLAIKVAKGDLSQTQAVIAMNPERVAEKGWMAFQAWNAGAPVTDDYNPVHNNNLAEMLPYITQFKAADTSTITFGDQKLKAGDAKKLIWDGTSLIKRVALPKKIVGGEETPDFDTLKQVNDINIWISENPGLTKMEINNKFKELQNPNIVWDEETKTFKCNNIGIFLTFACYASDDLLKIDPNSKRFLKHMSREEGKDIQSMYNNYVQYGKDTVTKSSKPINDFGDAGRGSFYHGNIYVPITDPIQGFNLTRPSIRPKSEFEHPVQDMEVSQMMQARSQNSTYRTQFPNDD